jgi:hypothetical protein
MTGMQMMHQKHSPTIILETTLVNWMGRKKCELIMMISDTIWWEH